MELQSPHGAGGVLAAVQTQPPPLLGYERELQRAAVLSLDQIRALRSSNEYTEGPSAVRRPPAPRPAPRGQDKRDRTHEVILVNVNNNYERQRAAGGLSRSTSTGSAASSGSGGSGSSEQGLLARSPPARPPAGPRPHPHQHRAERPVRTQPKAKAPPQASPEGPLKPPGQGKPDWAGPRAPGGGHQFICERCGKCKCSECTAPRHLPSCLACHGQCLCSAQSALEHGTCMCLVKGIFYHCSNDDEGDSCADQPCSLTRSHCCSRFLCMGIMSVLFPCLLCYPPVRGCLKACQACHDRLHRPGCRCKNSNTVYCKLDSWALPGQEKPS